MSAPEQPDWIERLKDDLWPDEIQLANFIRILAAPTFAEKLSIQLIPLRAEVERDA